MNGIHTIFIGFIVQLKKYYKPVNQIIHGSPLPIWFIGLENNRQRDFHYIYNLNSLINIISFMIDLLWNICYTSNLF